MEHKAYKKQNKSRIAIISLIVIVLILIGIMAWSFGVKPAINGFVIDKQLEARDIVIQTIINQVRGQGYVQMQDADGQAMTLVEYIQPAENN